jgi:hypothetical protein
MPRRSSGAVAGGYGGALSRRFGPRGEVRQIAGQTGEGFGAQIALGGSLEELGGAGRCSGMGAASLGGFGKS